MIYIYSLKDPITNEIRYIGKTVNINRRFKEHLKDGSKTHKVKWLNSLKENNLTPIIEILETCNTNNWSDREKYWISLFSNLTNGTEGGEDGRLTDEVRAKMSLLNRGENNPCFGKKWTDEERKNLSDALRGRVLSEEHKEKIRNSVKGKKIVIDGIEYRSISEACRTLNKEFHFIYRRLKSKKYENFFYVD